MSRATVEAECRETLGLVPTFIAELPDYLVESEWQSFKAIVPIDVTCGRSPGSPLHAIHLPAK